MSWQIRVNYRSETGSYSQAYIVSTAMTIWEFYSLVVVRPTFVAGSMHSVLLSCKWWECSRCKEKENIIMRRQRRSWKEYIKLFSIITLLLPYIIIFTIIDGNNVESSSRHPWYYYTLVIPHVPKCSRSNVDEPAIVFYTMLHLLCAVAGQCASAAKLPKS